MARVAQPVVLTPEQNLNMINSQIKGKNATISVINAQIKAAKAKGNAAVVKALETRLTATKAQLTALGGAQVKAQNKVYESTGQYDKLLSGSNRDAFMALNSLFKTYGLDSLAGKIYGFVKNGYSPDTISILLQDTSEYKTRFAGNEARKAAGLAVLSPAEYLATEASYRQIMQQSGMPASFYDQPSDFANWIGKNVSPSEIQSRVDLATQATALANPGLREALNQMGIDDGHLSAYFLDQTKALPILQKAAATAQIGGEALNQGLAFDQAYAEQLATQGITQSGAQQGYQQVAGELGTLGNLGSIYGEGWSQRESEQSVFEGQAAATQKKQRLLSQERGAFSGSTGSARGLGGLTQGSGAQ